MAALVLFFVKLSCLTTVVLMQSDPLSTLNFLIIDYLMILGKFAILLS